MESKVEEKDTKAEASVQQFGANRPTVSCTFDGEFIEDRDYRNTFFFFFQNIHLSRISILLTLSLIFFQDPMHTT